MDIIYWLAQIVGLISSIMIVIGLWSTKRRTILTASILGNALGSVSLIMLNLGGTAMIGIVGTVRILWLAIGEKHKWLLNVWWNPVFIATVWILYVWFNGFPASWVETLPMISSALAFVAFSLRDLRWMKGLLIIVCLMWAIYKIMFGLWGALPGELISIVVITISFIQTMQMHKKSLRNADAAVIAAQAPLT